MAHASVEYSQLPAASAAPQRSISTRDLILLTLGFIGINFAWAVELGFGTPYLLSLGLSKPLIALVWLAGPLSGLVVQPIVGAYSDSLTSRLGRRRPFIVAGGLLVVLSIVLIAYAKEIVFLFYDSDKASSGPILVAVFAFYLLDFSINAVMAACRMLVVDLVPFDQQQLANAWAGRMNGVGHSTGYLMGYLDLVSLFPFLGDTQLKVLCVLAIAVFVGTLLVTCLVAHEVPLSIPPKKAVWYKPLLDIVKAFRTLPRPIQEVCNVQLFAWTAWFPFLFYSTAWIASKADPSTLTSEGESRYGPLALLLNSLISIATVLVLPGLTVRKSNSAGSGLRNSPDWAPYLTLPRVWAYTLVLFALLMITTISVTTAPWAVAIVAAVGIPWGATQWIPFTLIAESTIACAEEARDPASLGSTTDGGLEDDSLLRFSRADSIEEAVPRAPAASQLDSGIVLGIHNMYIVIPQFISILLSSIIFAIIGRFDGGGADADAFGWVLRMSSLWLAIAAAKAFSMTEISHKSSH